MQEKLLQLMPSTVFWDVYFLCLCALEGTHHRPCARVVPDTWEVLFAFVVGCVHQWSGRGAGQRHLSMNSVLSSSPETGACRAHWSLSRDVFAGPSHSPRFVPAPPSLC